jgi:diapolycopene oxygenase
MDTAQKKHVLIIGAGLGGLSAAISLAGRGFQVSVFEKNEKAGGKLNLLQTKGFSFDLGPSIMTLPHLFRPLFENNNRRMEDYITLVPVTPHWRNFFEDGTIVDLHPDRSKMLAELEALQPGLGPEFERFMAYSKTQYDEVNRGYFEKGLDTFFDFFKFYGLFGFKMDFWHTMAQGIDRRVSNPYLRDILEYFIKYVGSSAYNAPGFMNLMPNIQFEFGLWYIRGGMYEIARALEKLAKELGVQFHYNHEVIRLLSQGNRVTGLQGQDGQTVTGDVFISNMEIIPAYEKLLQEKEPFLAKLRKYEPACSGLVLHLGLNRTYPQLAHHNFFYSGGQKAHFQKVFDRYELPDDPTIYLVAVTRTDPPQAPAGHDHIKILPHIPYIREDRPLTAADYLQLKERVLDKLERMGLRDLRKHIVVEEMLTPPDIERMYYSNKGSIYGVASDWKKNFAFKGPKRSPKYKNLFFTGGSINPGGGMPMVVLCGQHVARLVAESTQNG